VRKGNTLKIRAIPSRSDYKVLVTGGSGLVGAAVVRYLRSLDMQVIAPSHRELNLMNGEATRDFFDNCRPQIVVACAARVGGIAANIANPVDFLVENLAIQNSTFLAAADAEVSQFVFMASSCIFPRNAPQPMSESQLMTGLLEPTNESYAIAKLAGIQLAKALKQEGRLSTNVLVPCNVYGPEDNFNLEKAHVTSALVRKFVDAVDERDKFVSVWGTGTARRELMHSHDLASAVAHVLNNEDVPFIANVGTGVDHSIKQLAELVAELSGFDGEIVFDDRFPDGMPQKVLDTSVLANSGWRAQVGLKTGVAELIKTYRSLITAQLNN
jgi:GDP-L-fucose synthase